VDFGMYIKDARNAKGWSVYDLAESIGLKSPGYISRIEGRGEIPGPDLISKLAESLDIDAEKLFTLAGSEKGEEAKRSAQKKYENALAMYRKGKKK